MSGWPLVTLGEVFEIARGGSPRPIDDFITDDPGGINWVMISDASEGSKYITGTKRRIRREGAQRSRGVKPGDFLLTNSMSFGKPYIMRTSGCIHDGWLVLSPRRDEVDADFFYHLLSSTAVYSEFERRAAGATVKNLNIDLVRGVKVPLLPLAEQRRIAAILDQADALRAKRHKALAQVDALAQSRFNKLFGNPIENQKGWKKGRVSDFVRGFEAGKNVVAQDEDDADSKYRVLKVSSVTSLEFRPLEAKAVPADYIPPMSHFVQAGDLLFSRANTSELVGATAYVFQAPQNVLLPDKIWRFVWHDEPRAEPLFVWFLFRHPAFRHELGKRATGTSGSMKNISQEKVLSLGVSLPPISLQRDFAEYVRATEQLKVAQRASMVHLDALFASLQHRAFRGEL